MRLTALLPLHPAWADVQELDALIAHASKIAAGTQATPAASLALPEVAQSPRLPRSSTPAAEGRPPDIEGVTRAAQVRLTRLKEAMEGHTARIVERERAERMKRVEADVTAKRADLVAAADAAPADLALSAEDRKALRKLQFRQIALESQVAVLSPPARGVAQASLKQVTDQINAIEAKVPKTDDQIQARVDKQLEQYRATLLADMEKQLSLRRASLDSETEMKLNPYRQQIRERVELPGPMALAGESADPAARSAEESVARELGARGIVTPQALLGQRPTGVTATPPQIRTTIERLNKQRGRLLAYIESDVLGRVKALATERHWSLATGSAARSLDVTADAAERLKDEFKVARNGAASRN